MPLSAEKKSFKKHITRNHIYHFIFAFAFLSFITNKLFAADSSVDTSNSRKPASQKELNFWLQNMVWYHQFTHAEIQAAIGLTSQEISDSLKKFDIRADNKPPREKNVSLLVLPYPGGRHPRIGFLEGAIHPQRETKVSVFTPWNDNDYVVVDVPEAIWSNLGLTYLAHTHIDTIWSKQNIDLEKMEWNRSDDGAFQLTRKLPNGISFGATVTPSRNAVRMKLWLKNGTQNTLTDLRVQNCVMLKAATGFNQQTNENKVDAEPYTACRSEDGKRWIITAWTPCHRAWNNKKCPCLHSDPKFPDCAPGQTQTVTGWLSFYEGNDIHKEFKRIDDTDWKTTP